ncbi:hypothetical protein BC938DRAFT_478041 [Jimgerdemannia flammicorona]|uniref:Uncharacterized protein n=1 Tax=Jimgerdemannia flammicorona TaxID=994334 RepID=A0A433QYM7_9FUNG|nr:hypothetical protein BC938DRAFT_478041 [Jimgerdemannia flammicorona]
MIYTPPPRPKTHRQRTVSIGSAAPFSFSDFLARAFALAVVDNTAVATFSTTAVVGGLVVGG